jgi:hypothetical protein
MRFAENLDRFVRTKLVPSFELQSDVASNVFALRRALGSVTKELSRADLARLIGERHPGRTPNATTVERWEKKRVEPDYHSTRIMAELAGVAFELFALGNAPSADRAALERAVSTSTDEMSGAEYLRQRELERGGGKSEPAARRAAGEGKRRKRG